MNKISGEFSSFSWGGGGVCDYCLAFNENPFLLNHSNKKEIYQKKNEHLRSSCTGITGDIFVSFLKLFFFAFLCTL